MDGFTDYAQTPGLCRKSRAAEAYFQQQVTENTAWARRMDLQLWDVLRPGVAALDFGCGHGALTVQGAQFGARMLGIDTSAQRIAFAASKARSAFPILGDRAAFVCGEIDDLPGQARFDIILSKDTFEHVADIDSALGAFRRLIKPGGRVYLGFSPLWFSPFGDHGFLTHRRLPWAHLLLGEARFLAAHNAHTGRPDRTIAEAGFNRLRPGDFRAAFERHGFAVDRARVNAAEGWKRWGFAPFNWARHVAVLERFATIGLYVILRPD